MRQIVALTLSLFVIFGIEKKVSAENCSQNFHILKPYQDLAQVRDHIEESPFMVACKEPPDLLKGRPPTSLFVRSVVEKDSHGRTSRDFLKKIIARVRQRISDTDNQIQNIQQCMSSTDQECAEISQWAHTTLPVFVKAARYNLSLAQSPSQIKTWLDISSQEVNTQLKPLGSYKFEAWAPLTADEKVRAQSQLKQYKQEIAQTLQQRMSNGRLGEDPKTFVNEALIGVRYKHYLAYHETMAEVPLLQYLKGPEVTSTDLQNAFRKMEAGLNKESQNLNRLEKMLNTKGPLPADVLQLMNYNSEVEEILFADNKDCGLATSLLYTMTNRQLGNGLAVGLPILAVSLFAPPLIGVAAGLAAGSYGVYTDYKDFRDTQARTLNYIYGDSLHADLADLESSSKELKYSAITLPVGMGIGGQSARILKVSAKALRSTSHLFSGY
jgi:hypothetical protein